MSELVGEGRFELLAAQCLERAGRERERRARRTAADREETGEPVVDQVEGRRSDPQLRGDLVRTRAQDGILGERERARSEHPEECPIPVPVYRGRREQRAEREEETRR